MNRERVEAACCTVERLMRCPGLRGVVRGKVIRTPMPCPLDRVSRHFKAERRQGMGKPDGY